MIKFDFEKEKFLLTDLRVKKYDEYLNYVQPIFRGNSIYCIGSDHIVEINLVNRIEGRKLFRGKGYSNIINDRVKPIEKEYSELNRAVGYH